jgi:hypothetical protein
MMKPANTLLDPQNKHATWGGPKEEIAEASVTLKELRQKYDKIHQTVQAKQKELEGLRRDLSKANDEENSLANKSEST